MSVAGDIIDDLVIAPNFKLSAVTGSFGVLAIAIFVGVGLSGPASSEDHVVTSAPSDVLAKSSTGIDGGAPRPR